jgi:DNA primase
MIPKELLEDIQKKADIAQIISSYISVIKKGKNFVALCPFHNDKNPSLTISSEKQIFKCFVCGQGGTVFHFVQHFEKITFMEAVKKTASIMGYQDARLEGFQKQKVIDPKLEPFYKINHDLLDYYRYALKTEEGKKALAYLSLRGITEALIEQFKIGYAPNQGTQTVQYLILKKGYQRTLIEQAGIGGGTGQELSDRLAGRVIFPIFDADGRAVGFSGRVLEDGPMAKYVNSPETPVFQKNQLLFHLHHAKTTARRVNYLYVLEGFMDVIALSKVDMTSAVAIMGTALSKTHLQMLKGLNVEIRFSLDADDAGQAATMKLLPLVDKAKINYRLVDTFQEVKDPDEILKNKGPEALKIYLNRLLSWGEFALKYFEKKPHQTMQERTTIVQEMLPIIATMKTVVEVDASIMQLAKLTDFPYLSVKKMLTQHQEQKNKDPSQSIVEELQPIKKVLSRFNMAERTLLYLMLHDARAIDFFKTKVEYFYDEMYDTVANYILAWQNDHQHHEMKVSSITDYIAQQDHEKKDAIVQAIIDIAFEKNVPKLGTDTQLLTDLLKVISEQKLQILTSQRYQQAIQGKSEQEKAKILNAMIKERAIESIPLKEGKNDEKK